jgi:23S rRNA pseudouridine2605 synthase
MDTEYRIGQLLSMLGLCSRRGAADFIKDNSILFKGVRVIRLDVRFLKEDISELTLNGGSFPQLKSKIDQVILYNKPKGVTCSYRAFKGDPGLTELPFLKENRMFYAGRLDKESRGLLVFSPDGAYIHQLSHPSFEIKKKYRVKINRPLGSSEIKKIKDGIWSVGEKLQVKDIKMIKPSLYECILKEGKNRELRRIFKAVNVEIEDLCRIEHGPYSLSGIEEGTYLQIKRILVSGRSVKQSQAGKKILANMESRGKGNTASLNSKKRKIATEKKNRKQNTPGLSRLKVKNGKNSIDPKNSE